MPSSASETTGPPSEKDLKYTPLHSALSEMSQASLVEYMEGLETLLVYAKNLIRFPDEKKYRKVKIANIHYQERLGHLPGAEAVMACIGYVVKGEYLRVDADQVRTPDHLENLKELEAIIAKRLSRVKQEFKSLPHRLDDEHLFTSVAGASCHGEIGKRTTMEDDEVMVDCFCGDTSQSFFGLYDGHGGRATVDFIVKTLHMNLEKQLAANNTMAVAMKHSYLITDSQLRRQNILRSGSTAVTCVVRRGSKKGWLYTANVGDSRAVLVRRRKAVRLTVDHKADLPDEAKRITDAGGFVGRNKRVNGVLAISRALGDHMLKDNDIVIAEPHFVETELTKQDTHLLLACDGVWDVMTDQEAVDLALTTLGQLQGGSKAEGAVLNGYLHAAAKSIVSECLARRSLDNVTCLIVEL